MHYILIIMLFLAAPAMAQQETSESPAVPPPCSGEKFHQFDFWIGEWTVTSNGQLAGANSIEPILNGCVLQETWQGAGAGGMAGKSFNLYDAARDRWHQTWVDGSGTLLELNGGLENGNMVLQGQSPSPGGKGQTTHRITWTPNPDGSVRQLWDASQDGQNWSVLFDGLYVKVKE